LKPLDLADSIIKLPRVDSDLTISPGKYIEKYIYKSTSSHGRAIDLIIKLLHDEKLDD